jgi:hypothetical protein
VRDKLKAVESGQITTKAFSDYMTDAQRRDKEIADGLKAYGSAQKFAGLDGANGVVRQTSLRDNGKRLTFGIKFTTDLAAKIMPEGCFGTKALAPSGSAVVDQEFRPDPIALGKPAHSLLDVLPVPSHDTAQFAYLR